MFQPWTRTPPDLGSVYNCYIAIILKPAPPFSNLHPMYAWGGDTPSRPFPLSLDNPHVSTHDHSPTRASPVSVPAYQGLPLPASDYVTSLHPRSSPRLLDFQRHYLAAAKISSNVALSCFRAVVCHHHGSQPPPHLVSHLPVANINCQPPCQPLYHFRLTLFNVLPTCLSYRFLEYLCH